MPVNVNEVGMLIGKSYPVRYAEEWDNVGFQVDLNNETEGVLVCLDVTEKVIGEAAGRGCGLIVSHHPLLFHAIKRIDNTDYVGRCVEALIRNGISLYSAHTNTDNAPDGLNSCLADMLGLRDRKPLLPGTMENYYKIAVSVPPDDLEAIKRALREAGAGELGNYTGCTFTVEGTGTFTPNASAAPYIGAADTPELVEEAWIQALAPGRKLRAVVDAVRQAHPYEEPAIDVFCLEEPRETESGSGMVGVLEQPLRAKDILDILKQKLDMKTVRFRGGLDEEIEKIALCSGAGGSFLGAAEKAGAQMYITGEVRHNEYLESGICIVEAGHFDTEKCFCAMMADSLQKSFVDVKWNVRVYTAENMERPYMDY